MRADSEIPEFKLWHRIHLLDRSHQNGTLCLNLQLSGITKGKSGQDLHKQCLAWIAAGQPGGDKHRWLNNFRDGLGRQFDFYRADICDALKSAQNEHCTFDVSKVQDFTAASVANGGDFSLSFWYKPTDREQGDTYIPSIKFYSSLFPPELNLEVGGFSSNPRGEVRVHTSCYDPATNSAYESVQTSATAIDGEWTFFSYVRRNARVSNGNTTIELSNTVVQNIGVTRQISDQQLCLFDSSALFNAIVVNKPVLMSPISLYPVALLPHQVQDRYYDSADDMRVRRGPVAPFRLPVSVSTKQYDHRSALVAPPMVFQARQNRSRCEFAYSNEWVDAQQHIAEQELCSGVYECDGAVEPISCSGEPENATYFGLNRVRFGSEEGYAEFLFTISEYDFVFREGQLQETSRFADAHTSHLSVHLIFFSPNTGVVSYAIVNSDILRAEGVQTKFDFYSFNILDGQVLVSYAVLEVLTTFFLVVVLGYFTMSRLRRIHRDTAWAEMTATQVAGLVGDVLQIVLVPITIGIRMKEKFNSNETVRSVVESWRTIQWHNDSIPLKVKKEAYFEGVVALQASISTMSGAKGMVFLALMISLMRMLQETSLHPRLALLTGTLGFAAGHMFHALLVALFVMCSFAAIGMWRFGTDLPQFATFQEAMSSEMTLFFAPDPIAGWNDSIELTVFTLSLLFAMVLLVLNFMLGNQLGCAKHVYGCNPMYMYRCVLSWCRFGTALKV